MFVSKWTSRKGSGHLFRPDLLSLPSSSVIFGVAVFGEQKTPAHAHTDSDEWFIVMEGKGDIETDGQTHILAAGDTVYTPPHTWHSFQGIGGSFRILFGIYAWRTYIHPGEHEVIETSKDRKSIVQSLREARAESSRGKLSLTLLEPQKVGRNNCLGVNYCVYAPGTAVEAHAHETLEQVTYVTSGTATLQVGEQFRTLSKDDAVYVPINAVHSLENSSSEPVATVNAYYVSRYSWNSNIEKFLTKIDSNADASDLTYPSEI